MESDVEQGSNEVEKTLAELPVEEDEIVYDTDANDILEEVVVENGAILDDAAGEISFEANSADLTSLVALISGVIVLITCLTCTLGLYLLPFVSILLGVIGVLTAKKSIKPQRTQLWSWIGLGSGVIVILLSLVGISLYVIFVIMIVRASGY